MCEHVRGRVSLVLYRHSLIAKGEKLTARDLASPPPQGENGAPEIMQVKAELKDGALLPKHYPPKMRVMPSGRAVVCFEEEGWVENNASNRWDQLAADLATNAMAFGINASGAVAGAALVTNTFRPVYWNAAGAQFSADSQTPARPGMTYAITDDGKHALFTGGVKAHLVN